MDARGASNSQGPTTLMANWETKEVLADQVTTWKLMNGEEVTR